MSSAARYASSSPVRLLIVSPDEEDHVSLQRILEADCELHRAFGRRDATFLVKQFHPKIVICEQRLADGDWRDLLADLQGQENAPSLIVSSRLADEYLWAEVLNLGGCDVLNKPFSDQEVSHAVRMATERSRPAGQ